MTAARRVAAPAVLATVLVALCAAPAPAEDPPPPRRPDVLLLSVDALRADHLGFLGYPRATSPHLDALAARAVVFEDAWASSSWTPPSTASLLTGLHPIRHGFAGGPVRLPAEVETLAETMGAAGWRTRAAVQNAWFADEFGIGDGFAQYAWWDFRGDRLAEPETEADLARWMAEPGAPFLLWAHAFAPHAPYVPKEPWTSRWSPPRFSRWAESLEFHEMRAFRFRMVLPHDLERFTALYDGEIAFTDDHLGRLLRALPRPDDTVIVLVADHGEELKDHDGLGHYRHLHREVTRIPFVIALPGQTKAHRAALPVSGVDLVPTLRSVLGLPPKDGLDGRALLHVSARGAASQVGDVHSSVGAFDVRRDSDLVFGFKYAASYDANAAKGALAARDADGCPLPDDGPLGNQFAVRDARWTLLCDTSESDLEASRALDEPATDDAGRPRFTAVGRRYRYRLFDRVADPHERTDLAARRPAETRRLALALRDEFRRAPLRLPPDRPHIDVAPETTDALRGLGYVK
jgi:arylsulfatase A-like enzyme